jgi:hypothetical protein
MPNRTRTRHEPYELSRRGVRKLHAPTLLTTSHPMKHPTRKRLELLGIAGVICIVGLFCACGVADRDEMLRLTLIWGRLAPLPATAQNFTITEEGNMFTRSFRASFIAPVADVERWLRESPGTRAVAPERPSPTTRRLSDFAGRWSPARGGYGG